MGLKVIPLLQQALYTSGGIHATAMVAGKVDPGSHRWHGEDAGHSQGLSPAPTNGLLTLCVGKGDPPGRPYGGCACKTKKKEKPS